MQLIKVKRITKTEEVKNKSENVVDLTATINFKFTWIYLNTEKIIATERRNNYTTIIMTDDITLSVLETPEEIINQLADNRPSIRF